MSCLAKRQPNSRVVFGVTNSWMNCELHELVLFYVWLIVFIVLDVLCNLFQSEYDKLNGV